MKLALRIAAGMAGLVVVAFAALALWFALLFDPNDYRARLAEQVKAHTGRELAVGDIGLSFFPWLGVRLREVALGNAPGFGAEPFARVAEADVRVRLLPLLRREIEVDRVLLKGLALALVRDEQGRNNWDDLRPAPGAAAAGAPEGGGGASWLAALVIGGIDIDGARATWDDRQAGVRHSVSELALRSGAFRPGASFPLELSAQLASTAPALEGRVELKGQVLADPAQARYAVEGLALRFAGRGAGVPGGEVDARLAARVAADLAAQTLRVDEVTLTAYGLTARGAVHGEAILDAARFSGPLAVEEFNPRALLKALGVAVPASADPGALTRASLKAQLAAGGASVMLEGVEAGLDDSVLSGALGLADRARGALRADLRLDAIDLDRYLPPPAPDAPTVVATPGAAAAVAPPAALRTLDLAARVQVGQLKLRGLRLAELDINARAGDGQLRLHPLGAALYQGRYAGNITLDARGQALRLSLDESLQGVRIEPLLRDLTGKEARISGQAALRARLAGSGSDADSLKRTLAGNVEFRFTDGAVKGVNIARYLREAEARLKGQPLPADSEPEQTDFSELGGTLRVADGVARNDDLSAKSPLLRVRGQGSVDLVHERIDYLVLASVVGTLTGQGGKELDRLRSVTVPIRVGGSFAAPSYALDVERLLAENMKGQVRERLEQQLQQQLPQGLGERLPSGLREGLKGLFR